MRRLLILRHAKAERPSHGGRDFDRVLNQRGRTDSSSMGAYLAHHAIKIDRVLVSPAHRARETWEIAAAAMDAPPQADFDERLYDADPDALLAIIAETAPDVGTLLVVGHNPGLHELAVLLVASGDIDSRERLIEGLPTAGLVALEFAVTDWSGLPPRSGRLERFITPKLLVPDSD